MAIFSEQDCRVLRDLGFSDMLAKLEAAEMVVEAASASAMGQRILALEAQLVKMDAQLLDANPEIARLRMLIYVGRRAGEDVDECPWCIFMHSPERNERARKLGRNVGNAVHALDCPAYDSSEAPLGKVRVGPLPHTAAHKFIFALPPGETLPDGTTTYCPDCLKTGLPIVPPLKEKPDP